MSVVPPKFHVCVAKPDAFSLRSEGAGFLVFTRYTVWWLDYYKQFQKYLDSRYRREAQTDDYVIFDLSGGDPRRVALATPVSRCDREADCS